MVNGSTSLSTNLTMMTSSSSAPPPPPPPPQGQSSNTGHQNAPVRQNNQNQLFCPVCKDNYNYHHDRALNGHMRWHSQEQRIAAGYGVAAAMAAARAQEAAAPRAEAQAPPVAQAPAEATEEEPKKYVTCDLNKSPPESDGEQ